MVRSVNMKKTKKFKENRPENYHVHDNHFEDLNGIETNMVLKAEWIKLVKDRKEDQAVATLRLYHRDANSVNKILNEGAYLYGRRIVPKIPKKEPIRCLVCQKYRHECHNCKSEHPRCGRCAETHKTNTCTALSQTGIFHILFHLIFLNTHGPYLSKS